MDKVQIQFDAARYDPTRPVKRISFLDILDRDNREYLKMYIKYQLGVTSYSVQNIWARVYITKTFLRFLDKEKLKVEKLTAAEIDRYMRLLQEEDLGHKCENMTRRYINCIQRHVDRSSEQYYKEQKSLVSEWKEGSGKDGN